MCNLSQGIKEYGIEIGEAKMIINIYKKDYTLEQIADAAQKQRVWKQTHCFFCCSAFSCSIEAKSSPYTFWCEKDVF